METLFSLAVGFGISTLILGVFIVDAAETWPRWRALGPQPSRQAITDTPCAFSWGEGETPISVKHRDGWCALPEGYVFTLDDTFAPTLCEISSGKGINLPLGLERREPDCADCLVALGWPQGLGPVRPGARSRPSSLAQRLDRGGVSSAASC